MLGIFFFKLTFFAQNHTHDSITVPAQPTAYSFQGEDTQTQETSEELLPVLELFISLHGVVYNHIFTVHSHPRSVSVSLSSSIYPRHTHTPPP